MGKWCDYHNSSWHDMFECKDHNTFFEKNSTSDLSDKNIVECDSEASTLLTSTSTTLTASTIIKEKE